MVSILIVKNQNKFQVLQKTSFEIQDNYQMTKGMQVQIYVKIVLSPRFKCKVNTWVHLDLSY